MSKRIDWNRGRYSQKRAEKVINTYNKARERALRSDKLTEYDKQFIPGRVNLRTLANATSTKDRDRMLDYLAMAKGGVNIFKQQQLNDDVTISAYQMDVSKKQLQRINRERRGYENKLLRTTKNPGSIPDYYKKESFDPKSYTDQEMLVKRLRNIWKESGADYLDVKRKLYLENYKKSLERAYGIEEGQRLFDGIMKGRNAQDVERMLYENELADIDEHYSTAKVAEEQSAYISRVEEAFGIIGTIA